MQWHQSARLRSTLHQTTLPRFALPPSAPASLPRSASFRSLCLGFLCLGFLSPHAHICIGPALVHSMHVDCSPRLVWASPDTYPARGEQGPTRGKVLRNTGWSQRSGGGGSCGGLRVVAARRWQTGGGRQAVWQTGGEAERRWQPGAVAAKVVAARRHPQRGGGSEAVVARWW